MRLLARIALWYSPLEHCVSGKSCNLPETSKTEKHTQEWTPDVEVSFACLVRVLTWERGRERERDSAEARNSTISCRRKSKAFVETGALKGGCVCVCTGGACGALHLVSRVVFVVLRTVVVLWAVVSVISSSSSLRKLLVFARFYVVCISAAHQNRSRWKQKLLVAAVVVGLACKKRLWVEWRLLLRRKKEPASVDRKKEKLPNLKISAKILQAFVSCSVFFFSFLPFLFWICWSLLRLCILEKRSWQASKQATYPCWGFDLFVGVSLLWQPG